MKHFFPLMLLLLLILCSTTTTTTTPKLGGRQYLVTFEKAYVYSNNKVGNDWVTCIKIGEEEIYQGESVTLTLKKRAPINIIAKAREIDRDYDDTGTHNLELNYSDLISIEKTSFEISVEVIENGGQYAGNLAVLKFLVGVERVGEPLGNFEMNFF